MVLQLDKYVIAFILFGVFVVGGVMIINDVNTNYNANMSDTEFDRVYDAINDTNMYDLANQTEGQVLGQEVSEDSTLSLLLNGAFRALKQVRNTFTIVKEVTASLMENLGMPRFFADAILAAIILAVIFALIYLFMRIVPG